MRMTTGYRVRVHESRRASGTMTVTMVDDGSTMGAVEYGGVGE